MLPVLPLTFTHTHLEVQSKTKFEVKSELYGTHPELYKATLHFAPYIIEQGMKPEHRLQFCVVDFRPLCGYENWEGLFGKQRVPV